MAVAVGLGGLGETVGGATGVPVANGVLLVVAMADGVSVEVTLAVRVAIKVGVVVPTGWPEESYSYAPIEQLANPVPGRTKPRWSTPLTGSLAHTFSSPALIAGLPACSAIVCVGPPLFCSPAGSSRGSVLLHASFAALKPQLVPSSRLWPPSVSGPAQLPPAELLATMLLVTVAPPVLELL